MYVRAASIERNVTPAVNRLGGFQHRGFNEMSSTMRRMFAACVLAVMVGACAESAGTGAATAGSATQVNRAEKVLPLTRDEEAPALLVDKDDPNTVYLAYSEMASGACRFAVSTDRGTTWREEHAPV